LGEDSASLPWLAFCDLRKAELPSTPHPVGEQPSGSSCPSLRTGGVLPFQEEPSAERRASILVVEDEVPVRDFIVSALRGKGYHVIQASDGQEALALCGSAPGAITAAVVDIIMPNMSANDLLSALTATQPGIKILLTSGYSEAEARRLCAAYPGAGFIEKPYTARQLAKAVGDLISETL
jgi:CheY-like chemotaxis protein